MVSQLPASAGLKQTKRSASILRSRKNLEIGPSKIENDPLEQLMLLQKEFFLLGLLWIITLNLHELGDDFSTPTIDRKSSVPFFDPLVAWNYRPDVFHQVKTRFCFHEDMDVDLVHSASFPRRHHAPLWD